MERSDPPYTRRSAIRAGAIEHGNVDAAIGIARLVNRPPPRVTPRGAARCSR